MSYDFGTTRCVVARKQHTCERCRGLIHPGQAYIKQVGKYEGDFYSAKMHATCHDVARELWDIGNYSPGDNFALELYDELHDCRDMPGVEDLIKRYNDHARCFGGFLVEVDEYEGRSHILDEDDLKSLEKR